MLFLSEINSSAEHAHMYAACAEHADTHFNIWYGRTYDRKTEKISIDIQPFTESSSSVLNFQTLDEHCIICISLVALQTNRMLLQSYSIFAVKIEECRYLVKNSGKTYDITRKRSFMVAHPLGRCCSSSSLS